MKNPKKSFTIRVTSDGKGVGFHTRGSVIVPVLPFVVGNDQFSLRSNIPYIRDHVKQMMAKEGYNRVVCMDNDLIVYRELIADLEYIEGLDVVRM